MSSTKPRELPRYKYRRFTGKGTIRVFKLKSASDAKDSINGQLCEIDLNDKQPYEALSWYWGKETDKKEAIRMLDENDTPFSFEILTNLVPALRALRQTDKDRVLWIDAVCVDQTNMGERNEHVAMMADIYDRATNVCVWLGEEDEWSEKALRFIKNDVLQLWEFDKLSADAKNSHHCAALIGLMKRPWFSRRWVVQEIALANEGIIQCGKDTIKWKDFADAVSLFVEVETATHRLSEVMKRDVAYHHVPEFFGEVNALGASLLVNATSNLFRKSKEGSRGMRPSLEYLVCSLSVFEATQPRDTIYALLAIARDTSPQAATEGEEKVLSIAPAATQQLRAWVYKDFIVFSIRNAISYRALDILCRPWAPGTNDPSSTLPRSDATVRLEPSNHKPNLILPSWICSLEGAAFAMNDDPPTGLKMKRKNADSLVGLPEGQRSYSAAGSRVF
ncbi:MAG: hypothetical protein Q9157_008764 [Trypethelium eluteriae]